MMASKYEKTAPPAPFQVLLVDDEEKFVELIGKALREAGFVVTTAMDGDRGKVEADRIVFDVIVTDLNMPKVRGERFIDQVREGKLNHSTPVIVISGHLSESAVKTLKKKVFRMLVKPFKAEDLVQAVKAVQDLKRPSAQSA